MRGPVASAAVAARSLRGGAVLPPPPPRRDLAEIRQVDPVDRIRAARHAGGAGVLLRAVDPVGEPAVGDDVVELPGRLVVPGAPRRPAVDGDDAALIDAENAALRRLRIDPER